MGACLSSSRDSDYRGPASRCRIERTQNTIVHTVHVPQIPRYNIVSSTSTVSQQLNYGQTKPVSSVLQQRLDYGQTKSVSAIPQQRLNYGRSNSASADSQEGPYYGEYKCVQCGRHWKSTLSWPTEYQRCKRCKTSVYPKNQRAVRDSDIKQRDENTPEHSKELCQKCQTLGYYCGRLNSAKNVKSQLYRRPNNQALRKYDYDSDY